MCNQGVHCVECSCGFRIIRSILMGAFAEVIEKTARKEEEGKKA